MNDWSVAAVTQHRLKPRVRKTAYLDRKKELELQFSHAYHDENDSLISKKCVYNPESLFPKLVNTKFALPLYSFLL